MTTTMLAMSSVYAIDDALTWATGGEGHIYFGYSGRGMYGNTCFGVCLRSTTDLYVFGVALAMSDPVLAEELGKPCTDNLGYDIIAYWPKWDAEKIDHLMV